MISASIFHQNSKNTRSVTAKYTAISLDASDAEVITILILFHSKGFRCLKHFYTQYVCKHLTHLFPKTVSYNRFVELQKSVLLSLAVFIKEVLLGTCTGIAYVDSTPLRVCKRQRILSHKTFKGIAQRGKCSMGWFSASSCT